MNTNDEKLLQAAMKGGLKNVQAAHRLAQQLGHTECEELLRAHL